MDKPAGADRSTRAGTYDDEDGSVEISIDSNGTVTVVYDYNNSVYYETLTLFSYDGTTYVGKTEDQYEVTLAFNKDGTVTYTYETYDSVVLTLN